MKKRISDTRRSVTHKAVIYAEKERIKFFITVGMYEDGRPGEVFLTFDQTGSTLDGLADCWAIAISMLLQTGTTLDQIVAKFAHQAFEPAGMTECPEVRTARSIIDYVVRWMDAKFKVEVKK